jgi:hypothetical protein
MKSHVNVRLESYLEVEDTKHRYLYNIPITIPTQDTDYRYFYKMVTYMELCNLCFLSLGVFLFHNLWYHGYLDDRVGIYKRRKQEKENWRKRAIEMNLPPNAPMSKICQAEANERNKRIEDNRRERERNDRERRSAAAKKGAATRKRKWREEEFERKIGSRFIENQVAILDKRFGGEYHAPPEVVNEMLSQFKYADGQYKVLSEKEVELRKKKQEEWEELMQDDFLNRLKSKPFQRGSL